MPATPDDMGHGGSQTGIMKECYVLPESQDFAGDIKDKKYPCKVISDGWLIGWAERMPTSQEDEKEVNIIIGAD